MLCRRKGRQCNSKPGKTEWPTTPAAKRVNFQVGDVQSLPFGAREFDAAAMALVITFIPDPGKAIAEMKRVVRPGGTVATYVWDFMNGGSPLEPLREAIEAVGVAASDARSSKLGSREVEEFL
jgi:ubiquinone/menaquinone biosynthesis C-methylase UbiE